MTVTESWDLLGCLLSRAMPAWNREALLCARPLGLDGPLDRAVGNADQEEEVAVHSCQHHASELLTLLAVSTNREHLSSNEQQMALPLGLETNMPTFIDFRDGSGGRTLRALGEDISKLQTWREYTDAMLRMTDMDGFIERVRERADACSSSQLAIICAVLYGMDFAWLADELAGGEFWQRTGKFDRDTATAVAAAIVRMDSLEMPSAVRGQVAFANF